MRTPFVLVAIFTLALILAPTPALADGDGDGFDPPEDCDDGNAAINPDATEVSRNTVDENCDDKVLCFTDNDHDHFGAPPEVLSPLGDLNCATIGVALTNDDCDDNHADINPDATDIAGNNIDENCDGHATCFRD